METIETNKQWKRVPFDIELAKKIQLGEVEGRVVTQDNEPVRIICFDKKSTNKKETYQVVALVEVNGRECLIICGENGLCWDAECDCIRSLHIELPEEEPKHEFKPFDKVLVRDYNSKVWFVDFFSHFKDGAYYCLGIYKTTECIPYEGNEHLVGTINSQDEN